MIDRIWNKWLRYFGHLNRMKDERYPKIAYNGYIHGTTKMGRPKKRQDRRGLQRTAYDTSGGHMHGAGKESVESNYR